MRLILQESRATVRAKCNSAAPLGSRSPTNSRTNSVWAVRSSSVMMWVKPVKGFRKPFIGGFEGSVWLVVMDCLSTSGLKHEYRKDSSCEHGKCVQGLEI